VFTVAVVGSRNFTDKDLMVNVLLDLRVWHGGTWGTYWRSRLVSGGAEGADQMAAELWRDGKLEVVEHLPDRQKYGWPSAAFVRNQLIVDDADLVLAFFGPGEPPSVNKSGTMDTVRRAMKGRVPVWMYFQE